MNSAVMINNADLVIKELNGRRVVTFKDIDVVHGRTSGTAQRNFMSNRKHFIEDVDFSIIKPKDIQNNGIRCLGFSVPNRGLTLLTETGYLMIVKSFTDNLAWEVQRQLVNAYFRLKEIAQENPIQLPQENSQLQQLEILKAECAANAKFRESMEIFQETMFNSMNTLARIVVNSTDHGKSIKQSESKSGYDLFKINVCNTCDKIIAESSNYSTRKEVLMAAYTRMKEKYGVCWEQEKKDYYCSFGKYPVSTLELVYWMENKPVYKNLLISNIKALMKKVQLKEESSNAPQFPVRSIEEIRDYVEYLVQTTGNRSPHGSAIYRSFFSYVNKNVEVNWKRNESLCRGRLGFSPSQRISRMVIAENIKSIQPKVVECFNDYIQNKNGSMAV